MIKLTLPGSIRSKKNSKQIICVPTKFKETNTKHHWSRLGWKFCYIQIHPSRAYMKWEKAARDFVVHEHPPMLTGPIHVKITIYYKGRRPDLSGAMESVGDCLEGIIWEDDGQIESWDGSRMIHDLKNPRTELEVCQIVNDAAPNLFGAK